MPFASRKIFVALLGGLALLLASGRTVVAEEAAAARPAFTPDQEQFFERDVQGALDDYLAVDVTLTGGSTITLDGTGVLVYIARE